VRREKKKLFINEAIIAITFGLHKTKLTILIKSIFNITISTKIGA
jgi:hypothetical protein